MNLIRKWLEKRNLEKKQRERWKEYQKWRDFFAKMSPSEYREWRAQNIESELPGPPEGFYKQLNGNGDMGR